MMDSSHPDPVDVISLDDAYAVKTPSDNKRLYAKWASTYETSFVESKKYRYPRAVAEHFSKIVPPQIGENFVDIGCGTGIVGSCLSSLRPNCQIAGIDISPEMLAEAATKTRGDSSPVYCQLIEADLTISLLSQFDKFDGMLSAGTFTHGHLGPEVFKLLVPLVRAGGWFVIGVNAEHFSSRGFAEMLDITERSGHIESLDLHRVQVYEQGSPHFGDQAVIATFRRIN
ncbi:MAG: class I SAM-dependent methyltransferase [Ilumatobacteraceae bacterium]